MMIKTGNSTRKFTSQQWICVQYYNGIINGEHYFSTPLEHEVFYMRFILMRICSILVTDIFSTSSHQHSLHPNAKMHAIFRHNGSTSSLAVVRETHTHTQTRTHTYIHTLVNTLARTHTHTHMLEHTHTCIRTHTCTYTRIRTHARTYTRTHAHTHTHARTHRDTHAHTRARAHARTQHFRLQRHWSACVCLLVWLINWHRRSLVVPRRQISIIAN